MPVTTHAEFSFSADTTPISFVSGTSTLQTATTPGVFQLFVDISAVLPGDVFEVRAYERVFTGGGGAKRVVAKWVVSAQGTDNAILVTPPMMLLNGWDFTIVKTAGSARTVQGSIRKAA